MVIMLVLIFFFVNIAKNTDGYKRVPWGSGKHREIKNTIRISKFNSWFLSGFPVVRHIVADSHRLT